jgi:hypothetical protein
MAVIETLGEAFDAKWGVRMWCGRSDERLSRSARCGYEGTLDMATLVFVLGVVASL